MAEWVVCGKPVLKFSVYFYDEEIKQKEIGVFSSGFSGWAQAQPKMWDF